MEMWRDIRGYEGLYQVSNYGRVKSLGRVIMRKNGRPQIWREKFLSQVHNGDEHLVVWLYKNGIRKQKFVHVLVAEAFLPNPNNYDVVHHKDENPLNNCVENLVWMDGEEHNRMHTFEWHKKIDKVVYQYTLDGELIAIWASASEAARELGFDIKSASVCINGCCKNKIGFKTYKGYKWSYANVN